MDNYKQKKAKLIKKISSYPNKVDIKGKPTDWEAKVPSELMKSGIVNDDEYKMKARF